MWLTADISTPASASPRSASASHNQEAEEGEGHMEKRGEMAAKEPLDRAL